MHKGSAVVSPVLVRVKIGRAVPTAGLTSADRDALIARVRAEIQRLLDEDPAWA
jgi:hypothetical protein